MLLNIKVLVQIPLMRISLVRSSDFLLFEYYLKYDGNSFPCFSVRTLKKCGVLLLNELGPSGLTSNCFFVWYSTEYSLKNILLFSCFGFSFTLFTLPLLSFFYQLFFSEIYSDSRFLDQC
jgi:hypothetical protein